MSVRHRRTAATARDKAHAGAPLMLRFRNAPAAAMATPATGEWSSAISGGMPPAAAIDILFASAGARRCACDTGGPPQPRATQRTPAHRCRSGSATPPPLLRPLRRQVSGAAQSAVECPPPPQLISCSRLRARDGARATPADRRNRARRSARRRTVAAQVPQRPRRCFGHSGDR